MYNYKERHKSVNNLDVIEQSQLDRYVSKKLVSENENKGIENELIKGLNKYTYKVIWQEVEKSEGKYISAEEISEKSGVARVTVRRYLEYMSKEEKLKKIIEYGKVGRPQHKYTLIIE